MRRCRTQERLGEIEESLDDAHLIEIMDSKYPDIGKIILRLKEKLLEVQRLQGLKLLGENKVQFHLIFTFEENEQETVNSFITPADISEIDWIRKIFIFCLTSSDKIKDLVKISSCQYNAELLPHLTFLANCGGQYYFNADCNTDPVTAYWNQFRNSFLEIYKGPLPCYYTAEDYEKVCGYPTIEEFFSKYGEDIKTFKLGQWFLNY